jgi:hypothetical protein
MCVGCGNGSVSFILRSADESLNVNIVGSVCTRCANILRKNNLVFAGAYYDRLVLTPEAVALYELFGAKCLIKLNRSSIAMTNT